MPWEMRFSGAGGQGVILVGIVLAEAAGIYDNKEVVQTESYGGEVRGGAVKSEVIISESGEKIEYPAVVAADVLLAMNQEAANRYAGSVKSGGLILLDTTYVNTEPKSIAVFHKYPLTIISEEKLGTKLVANMIGLGIINVLTKAVSEDALDWALQRRVPKGTEKLNKDALHLGFAIGREFLKEKRDEYSGAFGRK